MTNRQGNRSNGPPRDFERSGTCHSEPWCAAQHVSFVLLGLEWPLLSVSHGTLANAAKVRSPSSLQKGHVRFGLFVLGLVLKCNDV